MCGYTKNFDLFEPGFGFQGFQMRLLETMKMAWKALGANKLRSTLTASGITIGIFSIISVMTAISGLESSMQTGLSILGSNIFQFSKYPIGIKIEGDERYRNRRN